MPLTGERTVPEVPAENYWFRRHEVAYRWVADEFADAITDGVVVDAGCGEGYGIGLLAQLDPRVAIGLELDAASSEHAAVRYGAAAGIVRANLDSLPLRDDSVDLLVSMQVIEHLWDLDGFLRECHRVLASSGVGVFSTPNRLTFSPGLARGQKPVNPFHVEEFDADQLDSLVRQAGFTDVQILGLSHGDRLLAWESANGSVIDAQVRAAVTESPWSPELTSIVASVDCVDFVVSDAEVTGSHDLVVVARAGAQP
jgi:SAM-dependent methyltransferase